MEKLQIRKRIYALLAAVLLLFSLLFGNVTMTANAEGQRVAQSTFETRPIEDDFADFEKEDSSFSIKLFGQMATGQPSILKFVEYGFSKKEGLRGNYGLYLYVYNPSGLPIDTDTCVVNMATSYNSDGTPSGFDNVELEFLDSYDPSLLVALFETLDLSGGGSLFYKFKVKDVTSFYEIVKTYESLHNGKRRYDVASLQLKQDSDTGEDYAYGRTYYYTGYAKGYDDSTLLDSTLSSEVTGLETINPTVDHACFRLEAKENSAFTYQELNTVYFGVPNSFLSEYGSLQKIKAEWFEYVYTPAFVTSDSEAYEALLTMIAKDLSGLPYCSDEDFDWRVVWSEVSGDAGGLMDNTWHLFLGAYNPYASGEGSQTDGDWYQGKDYWYFGGTRYGVDLEELQYRAPSIDWLFKVADVGDINDFYIHSDTVEQYMKEYTAKYGEEQGLVGGRYSKFASNLFEDSILAERLPLLADYENGATRGLVIQEIDARDKLDLFFEEDLGWWDEFWFGAEYTKEEISPIVLLDDSIISMSNKKFSELYYIDLAQAEKVKADCIEMLRANQTPVLFRFSNIGYSASTARFDQTGSGMSKKDGYVAQGTMFLDFDVIGLTFESKTRTQTLIPVVTGTINVINGLTPSPDLTVKKDTGCNLSFSGMIGLVLVVCILVLLAPIYTPILTFLGNIISGLLTGIKKFFEWLFHRKE